MKSGDTLVNVYRSQFAGTNKATAVTWTVGDDIEEDRDRAEGEGRFLRALRHAGDHP